MTKYDIFMHYYNDDIGKAVANSTECKWYPCLTTPLEYGSNSKKDYIQLTDLNQSKVEKDQECLEILYMSTNAATTSSENIAEYEKYVVNSSRILNPKYDMIFIWDGLGFYNSQQNEDDNDVFNQLYFDKMKRVNFKPWFFHSKYHSLKAAMTRANELIDLFGKDHIMIGKEVNLSQYIEIV